MLLYSAETVGGDVLNDNNWEQLLLPEGKDPEVLAGKILPTVSGMKLLIPSNSSEIPRNTLNYKKQGGKKQEPESENKQEGKQRLSKLSLIPV